MNAPLRTALERSLNIARQEDALATTGRDLTEALTVFTCRGRPEAIDRAIAEIDRRTPIVLAKVRNDETAETLRDAYIARMVSDPKYITRAVYGLSHPEQWPPRLGMTATDVLAECARRIECQRAFRSADEHHWCYDANRLVALRQAEAALLRIIVEDRP